MEKNGNHVLGSGQLFFDRFADGSKVGSGRYRYFGNTTAFTLNQSEETLEHYDTDHGLKQEDDSVTLSQDTAGSITCDDINAENLALWWLGAASQIVVSSAASVVETFTDVVRGEYLQLGISPSLPQGTGNVTITTVKVGATTIAASGNWDANLDTGMIEILPDAPDIDDGDDIIVTYAQLATTYQQIISGGKSIYGALVFKAANTRGKQRDARMPYVKLAPDGDFALKGDDWQTVGFSIKVLKLNASTERVYWSTRA